MHSLSGSTARERAESPVLPYNRKYLGSKRQLREWLAETMCGIAGTPASFINGRFLNGAQPYETFKKTVEQEGKFIKQSGGRGQYGHVELKLEPQAPGKGFEFVDAIKGGSVPREFIPAVQKGVEEALRDGVLAGYPVVDVKVTLFYGSYHEVDSNENAFKMAAIFAFKDGMKKATPILLEPIMAVEVETPEEKMGDVMGDLSSRRGVIQGMEDLPGGKAIKAEVPLGEMFGYSTVLRSLTQGKAEFTMEFLKYGRVPPHVAELLTEQHLEKLREGSRK